MKFLSILKAFLRIKIGFNYQKLAAERLDSSDTIFIHIPKTAGRSLSMELYGSSSSHHAQIKHYVDEIGAHNMHKKNWFAIIRNPEERLISAFSYLCQSEHPMNRAWYYIFIHRYKNLDKFIISGGLKHAISENVEHFIPQVNFLKYKGSICKHVSLYSFDHFVNNRKLHLSLGLHSIPHINKSDKGININQVIISDEARAIIKEIYSEDYKLLSDLRKNE